MIGDIITVFIKEWDEYLHARANRKGSVMMVLFPVVLFGIFFPIQAGREWVESAVPVLSFSWLPLLFISAMTADSFAGERERHTLETLLATRLPDNAILFGKLIAAMSYGLGMTALIALTGLVTVNILNFGGELLMYSPAAVGIGCVLSILAGGFIAGLGTLVSLRSSTVRQAHQTMSFGIIFIALMPTVLIRFLPTGPGGVLREFFMSLDGRSVFIGVSLILLALDILLFRIAAGKFVRAKMNFD